MVETRCHRVVSLAGVGEQGVAGALKGSVGGLLPKVVQHPLGQTWVIFSMSKSSNSSV